MQVNIQLFQSLRLCSPLSPCWGSRLVTSGPGRWRKLPVCWKPSCNRQRCQCSGKSHKRSRAIAPMFSGSSAAQHHLLISHSSMLYVLGWCLLSLSPPSLLISCVISDKLSNLSLTQFPLENLTIHYRVGRMKWNHIRVNSWRVFAAQWQWFSLYYEYLNLAKLKLPFATVYSNSKQL